jgi:hypothetical protein
MPAVDGGKRIEGRIFSEMSTSFKDLRRIFKLFKRKKLEAKFRFISGKRSFSQN